MSRIVKPAVDLDAKRADIVQHINEVYEGYEQQELHHNNVQHEQCLHRNVLFVGFPKSGKTTLMHVLDDPQYVPEELSLFSSSEKPPQVEFTVRPPSSRLTLNILEIPGKMIDGTRDLSEVNQLCVDHRLFKLHLICLCTSFQTGIDGYVIQSFLRLIEHLGDEQVSPHLCLIVTRCESKDEAQREKLCNELKQDVYFSNITRYLGRGIHFSGALNRDDWNRASDALYHQFENIYNYRKNIFDLLVSDGKTFHMQPQQPKLVLPISAPVYRNGRRSIDDNEEPLSSFTFAPVASPIQVSSQLPIEPLISAQRQTHRQLPESTYFRANPEKPPLARVRLRKRTSYATLIHPKRHPLQQKRRMRQRSKFNIADILQVLISLGLYGVMLICFLIGGVFALHYFSPESQSYISDILIKIKHWCFNLSD